MTAQLTFSQAPTAGVGQTLLIIPFDNQSKAPGIEWVSDSFPELLEERLNSPTLYVLSREEGMRAYDRLGIPANLHPSRATVYRIAEQLDVDYVLFGSYNFDGRTFTTKAQLLDMRRLRFLPDMRESGPLPTLINVQTALAWDVLHALYPELAANREAYIAAAPQVRLDAFENYIRGVTAPTADEQIKRLRDAVRLSPTYSEALVQLGKVYYRQHEYAQAMSYLGRVAGDDALSRQANFYLGLSAYSQGDLPRAQAAFEYVAVRLPLTEVYNNLGVVISPRDRKSAEEYFRKAIQADPNEPDYHFNLAVQLYRGGDLAEASRQLRETLSLRPGDSDAKSLFDIISRAATAKFDRMPTPASEKVPLERLHVNYEENSFRQLAIRIEAVAEQRLAKTDPPIHAQYHVDRGEQLFKQGFLADAEREFREALSLNSSNAEAHSGLAGVLEAGGNVAEARSEAEKALHFRQFADPLLVLARLDLRENRVEAAAANINKALHLEPANATAQALKRALATKFAQKAQPLRKP